MKTYIEKKLLAYCLLVFFSACCLAERISGDTAAMRYFSAFQFADFAGEGTVVDHYDDTLVIGVNNYWHGSFPTNPIAIKGAFSDWETKEMVEGGTNFFNGKTVVFFAMTNEWKNAVYKRASDSGIIWNSGIVLTNYGGYCSPKFVWDYPPSWFALETNDVEHVHFFSNIVESLVAGRDRRLFYTTTRDAMKAGESGDPEERLYRIMSFWPLIEFIWDEPEEAKLVEMINDPLLISKMRARHGAAH